MKLPGVQAVLLVAGVAAMVSCGSSGPSAPSPAPPSSFQVSGRVVDALTSAGESGVGLTLSTSETATTDATGAFTLKSSTAAVVPEVMTVTGPTAVTRQAYLRMPGSSLTVSLIPKAFNLAAFDEMFRQPMLQRWLAAPPLLIERREVQLVSLSASDATGLSGQMSDSDIAGLLDDLNWALPQLTGGTFTAFSNVAQQTTPESAHVHLLNSNAITVARVVGIADATGGVGLGSWLYSADGSIVGGLILLDRDFDRDSDSRRLLRTHELGHALGYNHVTLTASVMNPILGNPPTSFDLAACQIAFQRSPGNTSPDNDPPYASLNRVGPPTWSRLIR